MKALYISLALCSLVGSAKAQSYTLENLGSKVNSQYEELQPYITPDGKKLFFTRSNSPQNTLSPEETQDIWFCKLDENRQWTEAKHLGKPFNKAHYNTIFYQSPDGNMRLIRGAYKNGSYDGRGFSLTYLTKEGWSEPDRVKMKKYDKMAKGKYSGACLANDNKTMVMYFSEEENGEIEDIYVSFLSDNDTWTQPEPIGADVNTQYNETTPFLAADGVTLYFSSNRPGGYGSNDIYMTRRLDDTWKKWSAPVNLGAGINTSGWDAYYTIPASGEFAYMVSNKNSYGSSDIVKIKLKEEEKPRPVVLVSGLVLDAKTNKPVEAKIEYNILPAGTQAGIASSNPTTGEYQIILPYGQLYSFKAQAPGYYSVSENLDVKDLRTYKELSRNLYLAPIEVGQVIRLNNIFFESGKAVLKDESFIELNNVVKLMTENPAMEIALSGHTDNVGSDDANMKLSEDRSKAVYDYLVSKGISTARLATKGFGETKPLTSNDTDEGRQQNRRVEFVINKK
jgi:outer membrane protein OmpA-like peptidoglycan-associated protein